MAGGVQIHIIGLGVSEPVVLIDQARNSLKQSDIVIGSQRQLEIVEPLLETSAAERVELPKLSELKALVEFHGDKSIAILASGDPLFYGIGRWFGENFSADRLVFYPAVSSIQAACHKQGLSLQDVTVLSLHGRPLEKIRTQLKANTTLVILTDKNSQPQTLARECQAAGFAQSRLSVYENLGYEKERVQGFTVDELLALPEQSFDPLHVTIIHVKGRGGVLPEFPGIPDEHYVTGAEPGKGMISKREVRLAILSHLQPSKGDVIWDVGAGCGGVAVELAYWNEGLSVHAVECHPDRLDCLYENQDRFGLKCNLHVHKGRAPAVLAKLPQANKVFIGGSDGELAGLLDYTWQQLPAGGLLVASAVMDGSKQQLRDFAELLVSNNSASAVESVEIAVKRSQFNAGKLQYIAKLPVEIFTFTKTKHGEL